MGGFNLDFFGNPRVLKTKQVGSARNQRPRSYPLNSLCSLYRSEDYRSFLAIAFVERTDDEGGYVENLDAWEEQRLNSKLLLVAMHISVPKYIVSITSLNQSKGSEMPDNTSAPMFEYEFPLLRQVKATLAHLSELACWTHSTTMGHIRVFRIALPHKCKLLPNAKQHSIILPSSLLVGRTLFMFLDDSCSHTLYCSRSSDVQRTDVNGIRRFQDIEMPNHGANSCHHLFFFQVKVFCHGFCKTQRDVFIYFSVF